MWVRVYGSMFVYMSVCVSVFDVARGVYRCVQVCIGMYRYVSVSDVARGVVNCEWKNIGKFWERKRGKRIHECSIYISAAMRKKGIKECVAN